MSLWLARQRAKAWFKEGVDIKTMAGTWKIGTRYRNEKETEIPKVSRQPVLLVPLEVEIRALPVRPGFRAPFLV